MKAITLSLLLVKNFTSGSFVKKMKKITDQLPAKHMFLLSLIQSQYDLRTKMELLMAPLKKT